MQDVNYYYLNDIWDLETLTCNFSHEHSRSRIYWLRQILWSRPDHWIPTRGDIDWFLKGWRREWVPDCMVFCECLPCGVLVDKLMPYCYSCKQKLVFLYEFVILCSQGDMDGASQVKSVFTHRSATCDLPHFWGQSALKLASYLTTSSWCQNVTI